MPAAVSCRAIASVSVPLRAITASRPGLQKLGAIEPSRPRPGTNMPSVFGPTSQEPATRARGCGLERVVHRHIFRDRHDGRDAGQGALDDRVARTFGRRVEHRHVGALGQIGDAVVERQSVEILAAAAERNAADERRAGGF